MDQKVGDFGFVTVYAKYGERNLNPGYELRYDLRIESPDEILDILLW